MKKLEILQIFLIIAVAQSQVTLGPDVWVDVACYCVPVGRCTNNMTSSGETSSAATTKQSTTKTTTKTTTRTTTKATASNTGGEDQSTVSTTISTTVAAGGSSGNRRPDLEQSDGSVDARIDANVETTDTGNVVNPSIYPVTSGVKPVVNNQTSCSSGLELCCPTNGYGCGMRHPPVENAPQPTEEGQSKYGEYPWEVVVISEKGEFIGGGVLIHNRYALTVAHKIYYANNIKIRLGEWNVNGSIEPFDPLTFPIADDDVIIHPDFKSLKTLKNDIAILRLPAPGAPFGAMPTVTHVCLPSQQLSEQRCWVPGWGTKSFSNAPVYQSIMKEVSVPLVNATTCQAQLRQTRLSENYTLDQNSFICAGGEESKDACLGDGGSGLVCQVNGRFYLAGLVAWGIACGQKDVPGVYVNIANFLPWIQSTIRGLEGGSATTAQATASSSDGAKTTTTIRSSTVQASGNSTTKTNSRSITTSKKSNSTGSTVKQSNANATNVSTTSRPSTVKSGNKQTNKTTKSTTKKAGT